MSQRQGKSNAKAEPIRTYQSAGSRTESGAVYVVDGVPAPLEGEPPIAKSNGWLGGNRHG